eukprot:m.528982 g.528982  ORF g.528982 m.528982 type:complete len:113 (+) comp22015_c0_seq89:2154-2492(+)
MHPNRHNRITIACATNTNSTVCPSYLHYSHQDHHGWSCYNVDILFATSENSRSDSRALSCSTEAGSAEEICTRHRPPSLAFWMTLQSSARMSVTRILENTRCVIACMVGART